MILSVQKAMRILAVLSDAKNQPVTLADIAARTGFPKPTCAHILDTLCQDGYTVRISRVRGYTIGPALYCLTRYGRYEEELVSLCRPVMRWMERTSHATVVLSVIQSGRKFIIDYADSEQNLLAEHPRIRTDDIYRTATGRAILAHLDEETVREIYQKYGNPPEGHWGDVTSYESLAQALEALRKQDVILSGVKEQAPKHGSIGLACPLFRKRACIGAIGLAWRPSETAPAFTPEIEQHLRRILQKGTRELRRRLSYDE